MKKQLRKIALAVIFSMVAAIFAPASQVAYAATKTFTYAEQNSGDKVTTLFMDKGEKVDLKFIGVSNWKTYTYKWTSSNSKVAVVDSNGVITAIGNGIATITLKVSGGDGTQYTSAGVVVYVGQKQSVTIGTAATAEIKSYTVEMGKSVILKANGIKDDVGDRYTFNWSSTDTSVATVSNNGVITTVKPGLTVIQLTVTKKFSGEVMQATPIAVLVTAKGASDSVATPTPTKAPTATPTPTKAPGATATPTPTVAATNGTYSVKVVSDKSVTLTFKNKVTYTAKDVELNQILDAGDEDINIKLELESVSLDSTGKVMTVKTKDVLTTDRYNIKVGDNDKGVNFTVSIGAPNSMEIVYTCLGQEGVAYAYDEEIGLDVPINLGYRLFYNGIDVTETYSYDYDGYASFELKSPLDSENVMMTGEQIYFYSTREAANIQAVYTYYNANGVEKELKATASIRPKTLGKYSITGVANWTIIKNNSTEPIDWDNPVKSVVANTSGYKIVALLQDSYGYYYSTDERGVNHAKNIYSINEEDTLYAMKGYTLTFNASSDNNYYIDSNGELDAFNADSRAATYITLFSPDDWNGNERKIGAWTFTILAESKLTSIQMEETSVTLLTSANNNEDRFCTTNVPIKLIDQYKEEWEGIPNLEVTSSSSTLNNYISSVAHVSKLNGEWVLNIDGQAIYEAGIKTSVTFYVLDADTNKKSSGVRVTLKNPGTSGAIAVGSWDVGMKQSVISYGNGKEDEIAAQAELEIYQLSKNGAYKVGLLTDGVKDEYGNEVKVILQPTVKYTFNSDSCEVGDIFVLVLGPDGNMVSTSSGYDLGVVLSDGKVTVNVTESLSNLSALPEGKYTIKVTKVNSFSGTNARVKTLYAYFTVEDNTKDIAVVGYNNNRRTTDFVSGETDPALHDIVCDLFIFTLGGTKWTTVNGKMVTKVDCDELREGVYRIKSIEFAVPADGDNKMSYQKTVKVNQNIYTGVDQ